MTQMTGCDHPIVVAAINRAITLANACELPRAIHVLTDLVAVYPGVGSAHAYLGSYLSQVGRHKEAINHSRRSVELLPESELASLVHFHALFRADHRMEALNEMKRFLLIRPSEEYQRMIEEWEL
jgi:tetratricopeptide (TPR) repeat protein